MSIARWLCVSLLLFLHDSDVASSFETEDPAESYYGVHAWSRRYVPEQSSRVETHAVDFGKGFKSTPSSYNISFCARDLLRIAESLNEKWAQKIIDSDAKPGSGILVGNLMWLGDFYECRSVVAPPSETGDSFVGQYCSLLLRTNKDRNSSGSLSLKIGLCLPSTCDGKDVADAINTGLLNVRSVTKELISLPALNASIACQPKSRPYDNAAIITIFVLSLFGLLIAIGTSFTLVEMISLRKESVDDSILRINYAVIDEPPMKKFDDDALMVVQPVTDSVTKKFFKCFCILTNISKILSLDARNDLRCVHGIRFLSMTWVILGHTYVFTLLGLNGNMEEVLQIGDTFAFQAILQATFSVDSFFLLSGFLLTYLFLREMDTKGKINWVLFYVHRYIRLTPIYALILAFETALVIHLGNGPNWPIDVNDPICRQHWWTNLLYINNFVGTQPMCLGWSWYLANDMQFYVISPLFLYPLWKWPKIGLSIISLLTLGSWIASGLISTHFNFFAGYSSITQGDPQSTMVMMSDYFEKIYIKPYTRISVYLIGVVLGYIFYQQQQTKKPVAKNIVVVGWILAIFGGLGIVYGFYHAGLNTAEAAAYNALSRSVFGISLAWLIFACLTDNGGIVNTILSCKIFLPLSRLTYCAYLLHPILMMAYLNSLQISLQITNMVMVTLFFGYLIISYTAALFVSAAFESSLMAVEKIIFSRYKK